MSAWTPPPLDATPYGHDLADRTAEFLEQGHSLTYGHRDYCGMGFVFSEGKYCYAEVNDGWILPPEELAAMPNVPSRIFSSREEFVTWLSTQSDETLARLDAEDSFYHRNQTITRERIEEFLGIRESAPLASVPRWERLRAAIPAGRELSDRYFFMFAAYSEPHRHYHNLRHLNECLEEFDRVQGMAEQPVALEAALWFHDVAYDPHAADNESDSARYADEFLSEADAPASFTETVCDLILATRDHKPNGTPDSDLICDIDLAILGQDRDRFMEYEAAVRAEYAHVPEEKFKARRAEILRRFLERPNLYCTEAFRRRYEITARRNLEWSILNLAPAPRKAKWPWSKRGEN